LADKAAAERAEEIRIAAEKEATEKAAAELAKAIEEFLASSSAQANKTAD
jgi:hypothetical protein